MKIGAVCCIYDEPEYLGIAVEPIKKCFDKFLFLVGESPWNGPWFDNTETVNQINHLCEQNSHFELVRGPWKNQAEQRNFGLIKLINEGLDYAFILDSDEIYHEAHVKNIIRFIEGHPQIPAFHIRWNTYWKKSYHVISPREEFCPLIAVKAKSFLFTEKRGGVTAVQRDKTGVVVSQSEEKYNAVIIPPQVALCHHLSFARSDAFMKSKIQSISAAPEIAKNWYTDVWLKWHPGMRNLHTVTPTDFHEAVRPDFSQMPRHLQHFIKREQHGHRPCSLVVLHENQGISLDALIPSLIKNAQYELLDVIVVNRTRQSPLNGIAACQKTSVLDMPGVPVAKALNAALQKAGDTDICLVDETVLVSEGWFKDLSLVFRENPDCGLVGPVGLHSTSGYQSAQFCTHDTSVLFLSSYCLFMAREVRDKIGNFDERFDQDLSLIADYCLRSRLAGFSLHVAPQCHVSCAQKKHDYVLKDPLQEAFKDTSVFQKFMMLLFSYNAGVDLFAAPSESRKAGLVCR